MLYGKRVVLTTFAGRRDRMELLCEYVRDALKRGIIDEWHIWDFTRAESDRVWLATEFRTLRRLPDKLDYRLVSEFVPKAIEIARFELKFRCKSDFLIRLVPQSSSETWYEIVVGGWRNTQSVLRRIPVTGDLDEADPALSDVLARAETFGLTSRQAFKALCVSYSNGLLALTINGSPIISHPIDLSSSVYDIKVSTGYGSDAEILLPEAETQKEFLFVSKRVQGMSYGEFYHFYANHLEEYCDTVFVKCDDDILFFDVAKLSVFIKFRIDNPQYFIVSANVINNGVCAYYQQREGLIPFDLMQLDLPPGGFEGLLWKTAGWAEKLHNWFLADPDRFLGFKYLDRVVQWNQRVSINFISWLGPDLQEMGGDYGDDEHHLSVSIPRRLGRENAIFMDFLVCHLSFFSQDPHINRSKIIEDYRNLRNTKVDRVS